MKSIAIFCTFFAIAACAKTKFSGPTARKDTSQVNPSVTEGEQSLGGDGSGKGGKTSAGTISGQAGGKPNGGGQDPSNNPGEGPTKGETIPVVRVGINFEDLPGQDGNDNDFNDGVLCFQGNFDMTDTVLVSQKDQTVIATAFSESLCRHTVEVIVKHADGSAEQPITYDSHSKSEVPLTFKKGDALEVFFTPAPDQRCASVRYNMHDRNAAKALPNVCNNQ